MAAGRIRSAGAMLREMRGNRPVRRVLVSYASFAVGEFGIWITLLVYGYAKDGATGATVMVLVQLVPSMVFAPFAGASADRRPPERVLRMSYLAQAVMLGALAAAVAGSEPSPVVYVLASLAALGLEVTRPAQAALLPAIVRTPNELATTNVLAGWIDGAGSLVGPAVAGAAIAIGGVLPAVVVAAVANLAAAVMLRGCAAIAVPSSGDDAVARHKPNDLLRIWRASFSAPGTGLLLVFNGFYYVLVGALDFLCVVLAVGLLHLGQGAAGYLNAAVGGGATIAGVVTVFLAGRAHLSRLIAASLLGAVAALALIGGFPTVVGTVVLLAVIGLMGTVFSTVSRMLLQRAALPDSTGATFAALESLMSLGIATGALLVRVGIAIGGLRAALFAPAVVGLVLVLVTWHRLRLVDAAATVPQVEIRLLRSLPLFAPLSAPVLEGVARRLLALRVPGGSVVVREGDPGDLYYAVADGELVVTRAGRTLRTLHRASGFGEIALVARTPRTATVTATSDALLFGLDKDTFVQVLTGHPSSGTAARALVTSYEDPTLVDLDPEDPEDPSDPGPRLPPEQRG